MRKMIKALLAGAGVGYVGRRAWQEVAAEDARTEAWLRAKLREAATDDATASDGGPDFCGRAW